MTDSVKSRRETLSAHLKTSIMTLSLRPGSSLDEAELSEAFGLSRTPLREVFRELAGDGFLELEAGRGARVADMSPMTLRGFFLAAPMIYGAILRLATENATTAQISELKEAQRDFVKTLRRSDPAARALANNRFHQLTGEMSGNVYLLPSFNRLLIDHARIGMTFYSPRDTGTNETLVTASAQHDAIIEAIEMGDGDRAERLAHDHWQLSRDQIEMFVLPDALQMTLNTRPKTNKRQGSR